jgi:hypothetical protein
LGDYIDTTKKNPETIIDASEEVGLEVNSDITKYMLMSCHHNAGQNHNKDCPTVPLKKWLCSNIWE